MLHQRVDGQHPTFDESHCRVFTIIVFDDMPLGGETPRGHAGPSSPSPGAESYFKVRRPAGRATGGGQQWGSSS